MKKTLTLIFRFLAFEFAITACFAFQVQVVNKTGQDIYVCHRVSGTYRYLGVLADGQPLSLKMQGSESKIYFSVEEPADATGANLPDGFGQDSGNPFSFVEYTVTDDTYWIDISYIDCFSFPISLSFEGKTGSYGYTNDEFNALITALGKDSTWKNIIWYDANDNFVRIVGPDKIWAQQKSGSFPPFIPESIKTFASTPNYDWSGHLMDESRGNFDVWQNSTTLPLTSFYVKTIRNTQAQTQPTFGACGVMSFCRDNDPSLTGGQFNNCDVNPIITIHALPTTNAKPTDNAVSEDKPGDKL